LYAGVVVIDGNRVRFAFQDWKSMIALKILRSRLKDITNRSFRVPGKELSENGRKWLEIFYLVYQKIQQTQVPFIF
jgi:ATP-dependent RNA helicase DHX29